MISSCSGFLFFPPPLPRVFVHFKVSDMFTLCHKTLLTCVCHNQPHALKSLEVVLFFLRSSGYFPCFWVMLYLVCPREALVISVYNGLSLSALLIKLPQTTWPQWAESFQALVCNPALTEALTFVLSFQLWRDTWTSENHCCLWSTTLWNVSQNKVKQMRVSVLHWTPGYTMSLDT